MLPRHTFTTRLLYTIIPSENYAPKNKTVYMLLDAMVADLDQLEKEGIEAAGV